MPEWITSPAPVPYAAAVAQMEARADAIARGEAPEAIWLLEHPPLYTAGTSADPEDLRDPDRFPVFETRRGGQYTYHGPGQRVAYVMLDLNKRGRDVRAYVQDLEAWVIARWTSSMSTARSARAASASGSSAPKSRPGPTARRAKTRSPPSACACANGSASTASRSMSNRTSAISTASCPAASTDHGVTSLVDLGLPVTMDDLDVALKRRFGTVFGDIFDG